MNKQLIQKLESYDLSERCALITGAGGLLGREHARALLEIGARVVLLDIDESKLSECKNLLQSEYPASQIIIKVADISSEESAINVLKELEENQIQISILINNAAINPKYENITSNKSGSRIENFSINDWNMQISVGLTGAFICSKVFGSEMARRKNGVILNIASDLSVIAPDQRLYEIKGLERSQQPVKPVTYSVIKTGLIGLTRYLATYWSADGVRVNALSPGGVFENQSDEFVQRLTNLIPMGRMASSTDYHGAVQFLCSEASSYMTGQNLVIDGGRSVL